MQDGTGGHAGDVDDVLRGRDGHLFLAGGHHKVRDYFTGVSSPSDGSVTAFWRNARHRALFCAERGFGHATVVFPEKLHALSKLIDFPVRSLFRDVYAPGGVGVAPPSLLYPDEALSSPDCYARTDTHLSHAGTLVVLAALIEHRMAEHWAGFERHLHEAVNPRQKSAGDLGRKFDPPIREHGPAYQRPDSVLIENNGVRGLNDGVMFIAENADSVSSRKLLIFGDSFFRMMLPELAYFYRTIIFCRTRFFHYEIVEAAAPDDIFVGMAERYLSECTADEERPPFFLIPTIRSKAVRPTDGFAAAFLRAFDRRRLLGAA